MVVSVRFLLDHGVNPDIRDGSGVTPLFEAVRSNHKKCAAMIANAGGSLQVPSWAMNAGVAAVGQLHAGQLISQVRVISSRSARSPSRRHCVLVSVLHAPCLFPRRLPLG